MRRIYEKDFHPMTDIELQIFRAVWDTLDIATDKGSESVRRMIRIMTSTRN